MRIKKVYYEHYPIQINQLFEGHYNIWTESRMNGIKKYVNVDILKGKTLFEVGCGKGDNGHEFSKFGCKITSCDARPKYIELGEQIHPHISFKLFDCDKDILQEDYDIILHWGVLYHLGNPERHMHNMCEHCDYMFLETLIFDSDSSYVELVDETYDGYDQGVHHKGCYPTMKYVEDILTNHNFNFKCIMDPILNTEHHIYDWKNEYNNIFGGRRRFWICWKKDKPSPLL